ncbi:MAG: cupin domain-containing protein [Chthoniobacterales bacterium]|nr:cupin domain-containing protein [Chthoniobacterales bacterium]
MSSKTAGFVPAGEVRVFRAFGEEIHFHLTGAQTGGLLAQWLEITPPGGGPPPHYHTGEDEWFCVLEGKMSFLLDGVWREAEPGAGVFAPKNSIHAFKNTGDTPSRMLVAASPAGFEDFFERAAAEFARPDGPDMDRVTQIAADQGIHFVE